MIAFVVEDHSSNNTEAGAGDVTAASNGSFVGDGGGGKTAAALFNDHLHQHTKGGQRHSYTFGQI